MKNKFFNKRAAMAFSQILVLLFGIFAIAFLVSLSLPTVSADPKLTLGTDASKLSGADTGFHLDLNSPARKVVDNPTTTGSWYENLVGYGEKSKSSWFSGGGFWDGAVSSLAYGALAYGAARMLTSWLVDDDAKAEAISNAVGVGFTVGRATTLLAQEKQLWFSGEHAVGYGWTVGIIAAAIVYWYFAEETSEETITFTCEPWQAPTGGAYCEDCNKQGILPCSEYQCRSLGQSCELVNKGTADEKCVWKNPQDVDFPTITPWADALLENYKYTPDSTINPPDNGVKLEYTLADDKCIQAFTPVTFGVVTNEPAQCKIDYLRKANFSEMAYNFGGTNLFLYNHTQTLSLPGLSAYESENIEITNEGEYTLFVKCQDTNGNANIAAFVFKFCVDKGPDTTAPVVVATSIINGMPIANNQSSVDLKVYINEPAECKWDKLDAEFDKMTTTMKCSSSVTEMNTQMVYECSTTLTGLKNAEENKFYFKCKDQPTGVDASQRNTNSDSFVFTLDGTIPLVITKVGPNETVRDSTDPVKVTLTAETSAGAQEGTATCYYSNVSGRSDKYIEFRNSASYTHSQDLFLAEGNYNYNIKCVDLGGNSDEKSVSFHVESDAEPPIVTRAYKEENNLKIITDEKAECVYDVIDCNYLFEDGIKMTTTSEVNHFIDWSTSKNYYIKCRDEYGNQPTPSDSCSIIVKPFEIYSVK